MDRGLLRARDQAPPRSSQRGVGILRAAASLARACACAWRRGSRPRPGPTTITATRGEGYPAFLPVASRVDSRARACAREGEVGVRERAGSTAGFANLSRWLALCPPRHGVADEACPRARDKLVRASCVRVVGVIAQDIVRELTRRPLTVRRQATGSPRSGSDLGTERRPFELPVALLRVQLDQRTGVGERDGLAVGALLAAHGRAGYRAHT
jgi:hypothetical protein